MTSRGRLDDPPADRPNLYREITKESRDRLNLKLPSLEALLEFTYAITKALNEYFMFLEEDSRPPDPINIRRHMVGEMDGLWDAREALLADLRQFFTDTYVRECISGRAGDGVGVVNVALGELDSIRTLVKKTLGNAIRAALDDLGSEHVSSQKRQKSRTAALASLQGLAGSWRNLAEILQSAENGGNRRSSA